MKLKKYVVGLTAGVLVSLSVATPVFAAGSPSTKKVATPTPRPTIVVKKGKSDKTGETGAVIPVMAAVCLAGAALFGTKIRFEEE